MKALKELNAKYGAGEVCDQQEPLIDRLRKTASKGVSVWGDLMLEAADALAQPEQEPVCPECKAGVLYECVACSSNNYPPQREWVGLTDEERKEIWWSCEQQTPTTFVKAIEQALKEKNV